MKLRKIIQHSNDGEKVAKLLKEHGLNTVCQSARCPNKHECYGNGTATFMILGENCTRTCSFCAVKNGIPSPPDLGESVKIATVAKEMELNYLVITSVTRDDLADGGAEHFVAVVDAVQKAGIKTEVLIPDFQGSQTSLRKIVDANPAVIAHNLETVPRLYAKIRPQADYQRSLELLKRVKEFNLEVKTKSGLMLGLGEEKDEVLASFRDMRDAQCEILTLGQYLQPTAKHHSVNRILAEEEFEEYKTIGEELGFKAVASAPFVRSSYKAGEIYALLTPDPGPKTVSRI